MTPLNDTEKRKIVRAYRELEASIQGQAIDVYQKYRALTRVYRGPSLACIQAFKTAVDKVAWLAQLRMYVTDEIEETFWRT